MRQAAKEAEIMAKMNAPFLLEIEHAPEKCAGCGSHEFRRHAGRMICSYCRTSGR